MRESRYVDVIINPDGTTSIDAVNFHGVGCKEVVENFGNALGSTVEEHEKEEIHDTAVNRNLVSNSN